MFWTWFARLPGNSLVFFGEVTTQFDMDSLLKDIDTEIISIHFYNANPLKYASFLSFNNGSVSYDFLGECLESNNWVNLENDLNELESLISIGNYNSITINASKYLDKEFSLIQELAFSLSHGVEYLNLLTDKGINAQVIASKMQFTFGIGTNYFFEISKIRAFRKLWDMVLSEYNVKETYATIHSETTEEITNDQDKNYDILRNTTKSMSAIIGGCDYLAVLPHDKIESKLEFSNRISRNIHHILREEAFFDKVNNPSDGSYYIENITNEIVYKSWELFQEIENQGGFLYCAQNNLIQK